MAATEGRRRLRESRLQLRLNFGSNFAQYFEKDFSVPPILDGRFRGVWHGCEWPRARAVDLHMRVRASLSKSWRCHVRLSSAEGVVNFRGHVSTGCACPRARSRGIRVLRVHATVKRYFAPRAPLNVEIRNFEVRHSRVASVGLMRAASR